MTTRDEEPRSDLRPAILREAAVLLLFCALTALMTWPLVLNVERAVTDPGDPLFSAWVLDWVAHATLTDAPLWDANLFHPSKSSLAFSENMWGIAALMLPLFAAGVAPLTIHNVALLLGFALSGYTAYLAARHVTGSTAAAIVGGIAFAFAGFRFHHLPHLSYVWTIWMPLMLLGALAYARRPAWTQALLLGAATLMNGLASVTWFVFATPAALLTVVVLGLISGKIREPRYALRLVAVMALVAAAMAPLLLPYRNVAKQYGMERRVDEVAPNGAEWRDWLTPNLQNRNYGHLSPRASYSHERTLFPGFALVGLCAIALLFVRRSDFEGGAEAEPLRIRVGPTLALDAMVILTALAAWLGWIAGRVGIGSLSFTGPNAPLFVLSGLVAVRVWLRFRDPLPGETPLRERLPAPVWAAVLWIVLGALGARGLNGFLHSFLFEHVTAYRGIRMPVRWAIVAWVGIAVVAAVGMLPLLRGRSRAGRAALTAAVAAAMLFELRAAPVRYFLMPLEPRPLYEWIRDTPIAGGVLELPLTQGNAYDYAWRSTVHHKPLMNGVSSYLPPAYEELSAMAAGELIPDELFDRLERDRCSIVVVHGGALRERGAAVRDWLGRGLRSGRLSFVRRFDEGDWVFALSRVEPRSAAWRAPESPDAAGRTPSQNLARFLEGEPWFATSAPFVIMDQAPFGILRGPQELSGWAHAAGGVKEVWVRFGSGRVRVRAELFDRADVRQAFPWASAHSIRGFRVNVARPRFVHGETDFQAEIVDARGRRHLGGPMFFEWRDPVPVTMTWNAERLGALLTRLGADPVNDASRVIAGTAAIGDFTPELTGDPLRETDAAFVERVLPSLLGGPPPVRLSNRAASLLAAGVPRERVIEMVLESREFREAYSR